MEKVVVKVSGMNCGHCKMAVEKGVGGIDGVAAAVVNLVDANVTVEYDSSKVTLDMIKEAVDDAGFEAE